MAKLTTKRRNKLKRTTFGLPKQRKYPMPDRAHAANAKGRAKQQLKRHRLSRSQYNRIIAKANRILRRGKGSKAKARKSSRRRSRR